MISFLSGVIIKKTSGYIVVDVNGIGYEVSISTQTYNKLPADNRVSLFCHLIVREDAQVLYGFIDEIERALFKNIIKISGVGPKLAITILSHLPASILIKTVTEKAIDNLMSVPGIGKKSAERLMIELGNSIEKVVQEYNVADNGILYDATINDSENIKEASVALGTLGFKNQEINKVLRNIDVSKLSSEDIVKQSLRLLSK
ncbi:MAG: Holliday junction branch migration protein RuvA [Legionellales bacterium]|nr:Holliday junction branch migration protein RuvA [Legionellales bacterium]